MQAQRGYYSLIQFSPDASRAEAVNLGVLLLSPGHDFLEAMLSPGNHRARRLAPAEEFDNRQLQAEKLALQRRLQTDRPALQSPEDLRHFAETRAGMLRLTLPRPMKVCDPQADLASLFEELVGGRGRSSREGRRPAFPQLERVFQKLHAEGRAKLNVEVTIPIIQRPLHVPYAYQNGESRLVYPARIPAQEARALATAQRLAIDGDLLRNAAKTRQHLIVVPRYAEREAKAQVGDRIDELLDKYGVRVVPAEQVDRFAEEVERKAH